MQKPTSGKTQHLPASGCRGHDDMTQGKAGVAGIACAATIRYNNIYIYVR